MHLILHLCDVSADVARVFVELVAEEALDFALQPSLLNGEQQDQPTAVLSHPQRTDCLPSVLYSHVQGGLLLMSVEA